MRPNINPHSARGLLTRNAPFVLDKTHGVLNTLSRKHLVAANIYETKLWEFIVFISGPEPTRELLHVSIYH